MAILTSTTSATNGWGHSESKTPPFAPTWRSAAPKSVTRCGDWQDGTPGWSAWVAHLAKRQKPLALLELLPASARRPALAWGMAAQAETSAAGPFDPPAALDLISQLDRIERRKTWHGGISLTETVTLWLSGITGLSETTSTTAPLFPLECLAWSRALPSLASYVPASHWWRLLGALIAAAEGGKQPGDDEPLARQWLAAELPLTLAYLFPEIVEVRDLAVAGGRALLVGLEQTLTPGGLPGARDVTLVRPLLATWTRSRAMAGALKLSGWGEDSTERFAEFVRQALRLTHRDGTTAFSDDEFCKDDAAMFAAATLDASREDRTLAAHNIPGLHAKHSLPRSPVASPAANHELAALSILRSDWSAGSNRLAVTYRGAEVRTELAVGRDQLWSGVWSLDVRLNGEQLSPAKDAAWEEVCWHSDDDADYLELEIELTRGVRVQRQMLLARKDQFLLLADAVLGTESGVLDYRGALPLVDGARFDPASETREGYLIGRKPRALVFPLALPEWREQSWRGGLTTVDGGLELQCGHPSSKRIYAPLFFDLDPRRQLRAATWRRLTVAENRVIIPNEEAVGYRVQSGTQQWLIYRSLDERGNRTVLGQNLVSEMLVARFKTTGEVESLLEIE